MRNIPVVLAGWRLRVTEDPELKTYEKDGVQEVATDQDGTSLFVVSLFAKPLPVEGRKAGKGEEIRVTLMMDPGSIGEGDLVELIDATVSPYSFKNDKGETVSGISFRAVGLKPLG
ncbi:hypothetical protein GCM10022243_23770 [Saccharothrix violaceirubra]|uniref:Uncharacterized protein n=1 Tax=Saccharothrix violaceirubra TaxID=413306 RepID=A0A7W7T747_9PSEU|nr:hypothetical protein [Saccharothrix violaceirubra]MBB4967822.1 hypothetical protein [Saccharothrix violaceirubra]